MDCSHLTAMQHYAAILLQHLLWLNCIHQLYRTHQHTVGKYDRAWWTWNLVISLWDLLFCKTNANPTVQPGPAQLNLNCCYSTNWKRDKSLIFTNLLHFQSFYRNVKLFWFYIIRIFSHNTWYFQAIYLLSTPSHLFSKIEN